MNWYKISVEGASSRFSNRIEQVQLGKQCFRHRPFESQSMPGVRQQWTHQMDASSIQ